MSEPTPDWKTFAFTETQADFLNAVLRLLRKHANRITPAEAIALLCNAVGRVAGAQEPPMPPGYRTEFIRRNVHQGLEAVAAAADEANPLANIETKGTC